MYTYIYTQIYIYVRIYIYIYIFSTCICIRDLSTHKRDPSTHKRDLFTYGVASLSSIDKILGLVCKRALYKRQYSAKETYHLFDPTDRSHHIPKFSMCADQAPQSCAQALLPLLPCTLPPPPLHASCLLLSPQLCLHVYMYIYLCVCIQIYIYM